MPRGDGKTTKQMINAPKGSIFVWVNSDVSYPIALAKNIGRSDLKIVRPSWISDGCWRGLELAGIVVDHAVKLDEKQVEELLYIRSRVIN